MQFNSIRFKISILYVAVLGAILLIYSSILYFSLAYTLYNDLDDELKLKVQEISHVVRLYLDITGYDRQSVIFAFNRAINFKGEHSNRDKIEELEYKWLRKVDKLDLKEDYVSIIDTKGRTVVSSDNLPPELSSVFLKTTQLSPQRKETYKNIKLAKRNLRLITAPFPYGGKERYIIRIGSSLKPLIEILYNRLFYIAVSIPIILLFTSFIGRLFTSRILQPVKVVTTTARNISYKDLHTRVKKEHMDEEMKYLVDAFNDMITRLEKSFNYIMEFSSHVAHELKTPLAIIRGESEIALKKERTAEEYKKAIKVNLEEVERMLKTIDDLLLLTGLDYRPGIFKFEQFDLKQFLMEIYKQSKILSTSKDINMTIDMPEKPININADRHHLKRLFFNLINNAIKFTLRNGKIDIIAKCEGTDVMVSISDTGAGITKEDLPRIFEKFFHVDRTGQGLEPGNGLGLNIAQSIARIHNGDIQVKSEFGKGSIFTVTLPLSES